MASVSISAAVFGSGLTRKRSRKPITPLRAPVRGRPRARPASSRPTESRRSPGGTRSPSQRARASIRERDTAEARAVLEQPRGSLDPARRVAVGDVEGEETSESRIADGRDRRVSAQPVGESRRRSPSGVPDGPRASARPRRRSQAVSAFGDAPVRDRNSRRRVACSGRLQTTTPTSASSCPARYFVAECTTTSQPSSSGRTSAAWPPSRRTRPGRRGEAAALEVRHRQERIRRAPRARRGPRPRAARPSGRTRPSGHPSGASSREHGARAVVRALCEGDRRHPDESSPSTTDVMRPCRTRRGAPRRRRAHRAAALPPRASGSRSGST